MKYVLRQDQGHDKDDIILFCDCLCSFMNFMYDPDADEYAISFNVFDGAPTFKKRLEQSFNCILGRAFSFIYVGTISKACLQDEIKRTFATILSYDNSENDATLFISCESEESSLTNFLQISIAHVFGDKYIDITGHAKCTKNIFFRIWYAWKLWRNPYRLLAGLMITQPEFEQLYNFVIEK